MLAMAGSALAAVAGHAADVAWALWVLLAAGATLRPAGLMVLAAVTLTCLFLALLAQGGWIAAVVGVVPQIARAAALREKSWRAAFVPQLDPDAPGRSRPRAPSVCPAAA